MRDVELYRAILGLTPPWRIVAVDLDVPGQQVTVKAEAGPGPFPCPECQELVPGYDRNLRRWRHLDTCQFVTWIEAEIPRVECPSHGVRPGVGAEGALPSGLGVHVPGICAAVLRPLVLARHP